MLASRSTKTLSMHRPLPSMLERLAPAHAGEGLAGELAALVGVDVAVAQGLFQSRNTEVTSRVSAARPARSGCASDGHQVEETPSHGYAVAWLTRLISIKY